MAAKCDDGVYEFYRFIAERINIGIVLFTFRRLYYRSRASRGAAGQDSEHLRLQAGRPSPSGDHLVAAGGRQRTGGERRRRNPWLHNLAVMGDQWLLNYCPHLYQVPGYLRFAITPRRRWP